MIPSALKIAIHDPPPQLVGMSVHLPELDWRSDRPGGVPKRIALRSDPRTPLNDDVDARTEQVKGQRQLEGLDRCANRLVPKVDTDVVIQSSGHMRHAGIEAASWTASLVLPLPGAL